MAMAKANWFSLHHFLLALSIFSLCPISTTAQSYPPTIPPLPSSPPPPIILPPPPPSKLAIPSSPPPPTGPGEWDELQEQEQLKNIMDALIGAGDFRVWAGILSLSAAADLSILPLTGTLFIPGDDALSHLATTISFDPFIIPYHMVPQRLRFSDLQLFNTRTRLPTLLPSNSILITNNSHSNYTIDGSPITHPDLYVNFYVAVHGIKTILDYSIYGGGGFVPPPASIPKPTIPETEAPPFFPTTGQRSDAACLCTEFWIIFLSLVVCFAFAFKIHGKPLSLVDELVQN